MTASLSALGAVAWSDIAEARQASTQVLEADEVAAPPPVSLKKVAYKPSPEEELAEQLERAQLKRKVFGRFEGY